MVQFGEKSIVGQLKVREEIAKILSSERISHAYLLTGPPGIGKKALALAFAEAINGVENLSELGPLKTSAKSSWFVHPDIHVFMPMPKAVSYEEQKRRTELLAKDPYAIVDFANRPSLEGQSEGKIRNAFYSTEYFQDDIRPVTTFRPNEGRRTIVILANVEKMPAKTANAFLKILEEPGANLMFILTSDNFNTLLPTIVSRCQILRCNGLTTDEIRHALLREQNISSEDADYLARISGGNYALTRFYDSVTLRKSRKEIIQFLRVSYMQDATEIIKIANSWHSDLNTESQIGIINMIEIFLRDINVFMHTGDPSLLTNIDQVDVITKFTESLKKARLEEMIAEVNACRAMIYQNISVKILFTVLANRFTHLMRGADKPIPHNQPWLHLPAVS